MDVGTVVDDRFEVERIAGKGGMGTVYRARDRRTSGVVALKILAADQGLSEEAFERFRRESRMAASISDSHCVFVYGAHHVGGSPAISMELCPGETLEHRIAKREPIPIETAVRWTAEILEGLEAAHRSGVVHRDVKPSNCFITQDERAQPHRLLEPLGRPLGAMLLHKIQQHTHHHNRCDDRGTDCLARGCRHRAREQQQQDKRVTEAAQKL